MNAIEICLLFIAISFVGIIVVLGFIYTAILDLVLILKKMEDDNNNGKIYRR